MNSQEELPGTICVTPRPAGCRVPLSTTQLQMWNGRATGSAVPSLRMCALAVRVLGQFELTVFRDSLSVLVERHESLRTRIVNADGELEQRVDATAPRLEL